MSDLSEYAQDNAQRAADLLLEAAAGLLGDDEVDDWAYGIARSVAHEARPTLLALERLEETRAMLYAAWQYSLPPGDWACRMCRPLSNIWIDGWKCWWHSAQDLWATEPLARAHRTGK